MNKNMASILEASDKKVKDAENVPAKMLRTILRDMDVGQYDWERRVNNYYASPYSTVPKNKVAIATDKNNFNSGIAKGNVTWGRLMRALFILAPVKIIFSIRLVWRHGAVSTHEQVVVNHMKKLIDQSPEVPDCAIPADQQHKDDITNLLYKIKDAVKDLESPKEIKKVIDQFVKENDREQ